MDYLDLFKERDSLYTENFVCTYFQEAGEVHLTRRDDYPMLFVLSGGVTLACEGLAEQPFRAGSLVIADGKRISAVSCLKETILMEYAVPEGLAARFKQHPTCFRIHSLPIIPITGRLETWVEQQFQPRSNNARPQDNGLLALLVKYQKHRLKMIGEIMENYLAQGKSGRKKKMDNNNLQEIGYELPELI